MSDPGYGYDDLDAEARAYGGAVHATVHRDPDQAGSVVTYLERPQRPSGLSGLGEFAPAGICALRALAKVAYRAFNDISDGRPLDALVSLDVFRGAYNAKRSTFVGGFAPAAQAVLPESLSVAAWDTPMRRAVTLTLAAALGPTFPGAVLEAMPGVFSQIPAWFPSFRNAVPEITRPVIRAYVEMPTVVGQEPGPALARAVADDIATCQGIPAEVAPSPTPTAPPTPAGWPRNPSTPVTSPGGGRGGAGEGGGIVVRDPRAPTPPSTSGPSAGIIVGGLGLLALVAYGLKKTLEDDEKRAKGKLGTVEAKKTVRVAVTEVRVGDVISPSGFRVDAIRESDRTGHRRREKVIVFDLSRPIEGRPALTERRSDSHRPQDFVVVVREGGGLGDLTPHLREKAMSAGRKDAKVPGRTCIPGQNTRRSVSMDEWGGPAGERLAKELFSLPPKDANDVETVYFHALRAGVRERNPSAPECEGGG